MIQTKQILEKTQGIVLKVKGYFVLAALVALFGFVIYQSQKVLSPPVDQDSLGQRELELETKRVRFDQDVITKILQRATVGPSTDPDNTGDPNPFD